MRHVCAWCDCEYGVRDGKPDLDFVTHGICAECEEHFHRNEPEPLRRFLDRFAAPILCVDENARLVAANEAPSLLLGKNPTEAEDTRFGNVAQFTWSRLPGGCGRTEHCVACAIRLMVSEALDSGGNVEGRTAFWRGSTVEVGYDGPISWFIPNGTERPSCSGSRQPIEERVENDRQESNRT